MNREDTARYARERNLRALAFICGLKTGATNERKGRKLKEIGVPAL